jgi:complex iron-sulfur molybdoenzyme family reductase subunit gamma
MRVRYTSGLTSEQLLDPDGAAWKEARAERLALMGTPVGLQPTAYVRAAWTGKTIGSVDGVEVTALHNGELLAFRLGWSDPSENAEMKDTTELPDAAGILLPVVAGAPLVTMGAEGLAVNAWYWRADEPEQGRNITAEGLGTTRPLPGQLVQARGLWKEGRWRVVIARALRVSSSEPVAQLEPGDTTGFGVAIWEGSHGERAGIKAFSGDWHELRLDAATTARR